MIINSLKIASGNLKHMLNNILNNEKIQSDIPHNIESEDNLW